jgi:transposase-like protein
VELAEEQARPFAGEVEIDESYFSPRRVQGAGQTRAWSSRQDADHRPAQAGRKAFAEIVENYSRQQLMPIIKGQVLSASTVYTDGRKVL